MCEQCNKFHAKIEIQKSEQLDDIIRRTSFAVLNDIIEIVSGELQWSDYVECDLLCNYCGAKFYLRCETYHGSGGSWSCNLDSE